MLWREFGGSWELTLAFKQLSGIHPANHYHSAFRNCTFDSRILQITTMPSLETLPPEILFHIISFVNPCTSGTSY